MSTRAFFEQSVLGFLAPVRPFLDDPTVSEVMINGPFDVFVERRGRIEKTTARFESHEALLAAVRNLSQYVGRVISEDDPILEGHLPDGSRVEAILPPVSHGGAHLSIRRFARDTLTLERLVDLRSLDVEAALALRAYVRAKINVIIAGGTGTGKTSMLNALSGVVPRGERVIVIEDTREVQVQGEHVVYLETRGPRPNGRGAISMRDLFRASLRMRPDRVVVGEVRGGEALEIVQAMTSGHGGCMGTLHAATPEGALARLETMCLMSDVALPLSAMRAQIGAAIQVIVQVCRMEDGARKVTHITEVVGWDAAASRYEVVDVFRRRSGLRKGKPMSVLAATGKRTAFLEQLESHGNQATPELLGVGAPENERSS